MNTKSGKSPADNKGATARRSRVKLALLTLSPLVLAGAGYGGWMLYSGGYAEAAVRGGMAGGEAAPALPIEIAAESSFTHSFALSTIIAPSCGKVRTPALEAASEEEAHSDGMLVNLSWQAAARRTETLNDINCRRFVSEIRAAERRATQLLAKSGSAIPAGH